MTLSVSIRPAVPSDIAAINHLFELLYEHHRVALPDVLRKPTGARRDAKIIGLFVSRFEIGAGQRRS